MKTSIVKDCLDELTPFIAKVINTSIDSSTVPSSMKKALVTPLIKKSTLNAKDLKNYRPVSNLSFLSKVLEKAICTQLSIHKDVNNLREPMQSAYHKLHSTETAIMKFTDDILREMDIGECTIVTMLDFSAAFDTVDHGILLNRLGTSFGIKGQCHNWIKSYLSDRMQQVVINNVLSAEIIMNYNLPQGSLFGPDLYPDFTKPRGNVIREQKVDPNFYADDSQMSKHFKPRSHKSIQQAVKCIEHCRANVKRWISSNLLQLNESKTEVIIMG